MSFFVKSWIRDIDWCTFLVRSLRKFAPESEVVVVVEGMCVDAFKGRLKPIGKTGLSVLAVEDVLPEAMSIRDGYVRQEYVKLRADEVLPRPHVQIDSDTVLTAPVGPGTWMGPSGRPKWHFLRYDDFPAAVPMVHDPRVWKEPTERLTGFTVDREYMRRPTYWMEPEVLAGTRRRVEEVAGRPLVDVLRSYRIGQVSEYNLCGAVADRLYHDRYEWIEASGSEYVDDLPVFLSWSWGGISAGRWMQLERIVQ